MPADIVIKNAWVADGELPIRIADVAVSGSIISAVAANLPVSGCRELLDGTGLLLCPGFIDMHAHSALQPFCDARLTPKIAQGFTTELICPDGLGPAPVSWQRREARRKYLAALEGQGPADWPWETFSEYFDALRAVRPLTDLVSSVPHSALRDLVVGESRRYADIAELDRMRKEARLCFEAGARALSFGLIYAPGLFADQAELVGLAKVAAAYDALVTIHIRNESRGILDALVECVDIAELAGARLHISHLKLVSSPWMVDGLADLIIASGERVDLSYDQYPYGAGSTMLSALLPPWALDGGPAAILHRLDSKSDRMRIARDMEDGITGWENLYGSCGAANIVISQAAGVRRHDVGKTVAQIATEQGVDTTIAVIDLLIDAQLDVAIIDHYASERVVRAIFSLPGGLVGSDGIFNEHPHPRLYGTAARVLGRYAFRDRLISIEEAIARLSARAADRLGLDDRGRIKPGLRADLVLMDLRQFIDTATYDHPRRFPPGVRSVFVAGHRVYPDNLNVPHGRRGDGR